MRSPAEPAPVLVYSEGTAEYFEVASEEWDEDAVYALRVAVEGPDVLPPGFDATARATCDRCTHETRVPFVRYEPPRRHGTAYGTEWWVYAGTCQNCGGEVEAWH